MWLAHNFPGLAITPESIDEMTPEQTGALIDAGKKVLKPEAEERFAHTRVVAQAAGLRLR